LATRPKREETDVRALTAPSLDALGRDLLIVSRLRVAISLMMPFVFAAAFFVAMAGGHVMASIACTMLLTFFTYGSISHDLVHGTLRLPRRVVDVLLCAMELIAFRSGHAYRIAHLHHHARFPEPDDIEGGAARMTWWRALVDGLWLQPRIWTFAVRRGRDRAWILAEGVLVMALLAASIAAIPWTTAPVLYAALTIAGSWVFPLLTSYIPHDADAETDLGRTRRFRGRILSIVALEHLYHLEHHLYPAVPHHNWPALARRLDPYFDRAGVRPVKLLF
jgi:beta-carotene hydroxylase